MAFGLENVFGAQVVCCPLGTESVFAGVRGDRNVSSVPFYVAIGVGY
jgi:hypothetical protein